MLYRKLFVSLTISTSLLSLVSCAGLSITPPAADRQTLLVLPIKLTNETMLQKQGFYYRYRIEDTGDRNISMDVVIKLPSKEGFMIVDSLPPGDYAVTRFSYHPVGTGVSFSGNNTQRRNDRFVLESGKITIFSQTLHVLMRNETVGRMGETYFEFQMEPTSRQKENEITQTLEGLPNIETWNFR